MTSATLFQETEIYIFRTDHKRCCVLHVIYFLHVIYLFAFLVQLAGTLNILQKCTFLKVTNKRYVT